MFIKELDVTELASLLSESADVVLYDVRTPAEIAAGIIPNAEAMPLTVLPLRLQDIPRDKQVILYCRTGARSAHACMYLAQHGFENVYNLRGGIVVWAQQGEQIAPGLRLG